MSAEPEEKKKKKEEEGNPARADTQTGAHTAGCIHNTVTLSLNRLLLSLRVCVALLCTPTAAAEA